MASDNKRVTMKLPRDLVDRITSMRELTTEGSLAAFVRSLVGRGLDVFVKEMAESFKPNDSFDNRGTQFPNRIWEASEIMQAIASKVDAQQNDNENDPRHLSLADLILLAQEHGPDRVKRWLDRQAHKNQAYQERLEEEEQIWFATHPEDDSTDDDFVDRYSQEYYVSLKSEEIANSTD